MLNIKKLLTKITNSIGSDSADATAGSALTRGFCRCIKDRASGTIRLYFYFVATQNLNTGTYLFTIPSGYRPSEEITGAIVTIDSSSRPDAGTCKITTGGVITQNVGSVIRQGFGVVEYKVGGGSQ